MFEKSKSNKGYAAIFVCLLMPVMIMIMGLCIDGSLVIYYRAKLMTATKLAAISATSYYEVVDGNIQIIDEKALDAAVRSLQYNFTDAELIHFEKDTLNLSQCTVETKVEVPIFFMKTAQIFGVEVNHIYLHESYTAQRNMES